MSLQQSIQREFARLEKLAPTSPDGGAFAVDTSHGRLDCELTQLDQVGCSFLSFVLTSDKLAGAPVDRLQKISDSLCSRLSYLLEPIALIESDTENCVVQLRSNPPLKQDDSSTYYELVVRQGGQLDLRRFQKTSGAQRQLVAASVTREVFQRLAVDFRCCGNRSVIRVLPPHRGNHT